MANDFVPLAAPAATLPDATFTSLNLKAPATNPPSTPAPAPASAHAVSGNCAQPVVTLQRQGEVVTGIRIQCPCGQVIDLSCVY